MIIYGYRNRNVEIGRGSFVCPKCGAERDYKHINVVRYFTLFFIQLFPLGKLSSYIECQTCFRTFKPEEIAATPGNQQLAADLVVRKAESDRKNKAIRGRSLLVIGGIIAAISLCMLAILTAFQLTNDRGPTDDILGTFMLAAICPLPLLAAGAGLLWWGVRTRRSLAEETASAPLVV